MPCPVLILRPEPAASKTASRARALGLEPVVAPLFTIKPLAWQAPDPAAFDAVMLTSANAPRLAGASLARFGHLPCYAVGEATAGAAREAGFDTVRTGPLDAAALAALMAAEGVRSAFHPGGRERAQLGGPPFAIEEVAVYQACPVACLPAAAEEALAKGAVALIHSPAAGTLLATLATKQRKRTHLAAISEAAAAAAGSGWCSTSVAARPREEALLELAVKLCHQEVQ